MRYNIHLPRLTSNCLYLVHIVLLDEFVQFCVKLIEHLEQEEWMYQQVRAVEMRSMHTPSQTYLHYLNRSHISCHISEANDVREKDGHKVKLF